MNRNSLPIQFEEIKSMKNVIDDRFIPVKIWIAHTGENRNNCFFSKEVLESMIDSLSNIPILGYIAVNEDNETDFMAHEERLQIDGSNIKLKYVGHAYGMIPMDNDAHFELRYGEDGVEREYLVVNGLLWRKFKEVEEIFDRDGGFKSQSMELHPSSVEGYKDEHGVFVFTKAKFEGACILGENVTPAMVSSTIEKFSVANKIQNELSEMLTEFNAHFSAIKEKGEDKLEEENKVQETENTEFESQEGTQEENTENFEATNNEESTGIEQTEFAKGDEGEEEEEEKEEDPKEDEDEDEEENEKFTLKFELSHDDIRSSLYSALGEHNGFKDGYTWISKVYDNHAVLEYETYVNDRYEAKFFKINYVKHESAVSLGDFEEIFPMFLTLGEKEQLDASRNNFSVLEEEVKNLREFKSQIELVEKESKLAQYSSVLVKEDYEAIKTNLVNFSIEDIEKEIGFMLLKQNHFSAQSEEATRSRVGATNSSTDSNPYGSASVYFSK